MEHHQYIQTQAALVQLEAKFKKKSWLVGGMLGAFTFILLGKCSNKGTPN